jgi:protein-L-isoaspartate(D-aspartate) O-methyltransferase
MRGFASLLLWVAFPGWAVAAEEPDYAGLRREMVGLVEIGAVMTGDDTGVTELDPRVLDAMRQVPRHLFVAEPFRPYAYSNHPLPLGYDQNLASPFLVALMTHLAALEADSVVFETGTGAGYHAALLARLAAQVYSVEVIAPLAAQATATLAGLGLGNVRIKQGDGYYGWADHAPYDAIIVKEAVDHVPVPLLNQLKPGGRMVIPLNAIDGGQMLTVVLKASDGGTKHLPVLPVLFSPLQGGERT